MIYSDSYSSVLTWALLLDFTAQSTAAMYNRMTITPNVSWSSCIIV